MSVAICEAAGCQARATRAHGVLPAVVVLCAVHARAATKASFR